jgi:hypothetical protein
VPPSTHGDSKEEHVLTIIPPATGRHPLLFQQLGEPCLPAYLELDLNRRVVSFTYWHHNSEPAYVTLGHACWWQIRAMTSRRAAVTLAKELQALLERVCDGYSTDWDGRNHIGVLDADAKAARQELRRILGERLHPYPD